MNPSGKMRYYPGSPYCADKVMREQDRLRLFELHPSRQQDPGRKFPQARSACCRAGRAPGARGKRVMIQRGDGFLGLKALLPPPSRRGLVLIDPPYEDKDDYRRVKDDAGRCAGALCHRDLCGVVSGAAAHGVAPVADKLKRLPANGWLNVTLSISAPSPDGFGLHSSGMFILNPP